MRLSVLTSASSTMTRYMKRSSRFCGTTLLNNTQHQHRHPSDTKEKNIDRLSLYYTLFGVTGTMRLKAREVTHHGGKPG